MLLYGRKVLGKMLLLRLHAGPCFNAGNVCLSLLPQKTALPALASGFGEWRDFIVRLFCFAVYGTCSEKQCAGSAAFLFRR